MATRKTPKDNSSGGDLITIAELCRRTGHSDPQIRGMKATGFLRENIEWFRRGKRRILIDYDAFKRRVKEKN